MNGINEIRSRIRKAIDEGPKNSWIHVRLENSDIIELFDYIDNLEKNVTRYIGLAAKHSREASMLKCHAENIYSALKNWRDWENGQIEKDGPYVGIKINELLNRADSTLTEFEKWKKDNNE